MTGEANTSHAVPTGTQSAAVVEFRNGRGVAFDLVEHPPTASAVAEASVTGRPPEAVAETVVPRDGPACALAIVPARDVLDARKLRDLHTAGKDLRLASEEEAHDFRTLEVSAVPPAGPLSPMGEVIDRRLLDHARILCGGGDHRYSIALDLQDLVRLKSATVCDVRAED